MAHHELWVYNSFNYILHYLRNPTYPPVPNPFRACVVFFDGFKVPHTTGNLNLLTPAIADCHLHACRMQGVHSEAMTETQVHVFLAVKNAGFANAM